MFRLGFFLSFGKSQRVAVFYFISFRDGQEVTWHNADARAGQN